MSPQTGRRLHLILLVLWIVPGLPISLWLRNSVPWVVAMSWYAIVVSHAAAYSAERPSEIADD